MTQFVFLKAVNVGGGSKVPMKELVSQIKTCGIEEVSFYMNSGNLIINSGLTPEKILFHVDQSVKMFKPDGATLFIKSEQQIREILSINPFINRDIDRSKLLIYTLSKSVTDFSMINSNPKIVEEFFGNEDVLYVYYHNGIGKSAFTTNYIDKVLKVESTGRNLNTIETILEKSAS